MATRAALHSLWGLADPQQERGIRCCRRTKVRSHAKKQKQVSTWKLYLENKNNCFTPIRVAMTKAQGTSVSLDLEKL
jgi:hypothetical protein